MARQDLIEKVQQITDAVAVKNSFRKTFYEDGGSSLSFYIVVDDYLGIDISIDLRDQVISFYMLRLENGEQYQQGYYSNKDAGTIRLFFQNISKYFNLSYDKKRSLQLMDYANSDEIPNKLSEGLLFYQDIIENKNGVLTELHKPEVWEQIKQQR